MSDAGPTRILGRFISRAGGTPLPRAVADKAAFCLLDAIGLAVIASSEATFAATRSLLVELPASHPRVARVWSDGAWVPVPEATLANAIAIHAQFHDDSCNVSWTHPGSFVIPPAIACAEATGATLSTLLAAIAAGYNAVEWLGANQRVARALIERGIRTSPTLGTIAAAAAAGVVLGLDEDQATSAIGMSASITGGVLEPVGCGSDEWRLQNAHAACGGLVSAQLAAKGVLGAPAGLEGPHGLLRSLAGLKEIPPEWLEPPRVEAIIDICAKPWATLGDNMSPVIAAQLARDHKVDVATIRGIEIKVWTAFTKYPGTSYAGPFDTIAQAIASMTFSTAAMLVYGELEYDIPVDHRNDPKILRLVPLIKIIPDDDGGPYDATVTIDLADGTRVVLDARDAPRTLLFHDRPTSRDLIERRCIAAGWRVGTGARLADAVFAAVDGAEAITAREFLDLLQDGK